MIVDQDRQDEVYGDLDQQPRPPLAPRSPRLRSHHGDCPTVDDCRFGCFAMLPAAEPRLPMRGGDRQASRRIGSTFRLGSEPRRVDVYPVIIHQMLASST